MLNKCSIQYILRNDVPRAVIKLKVIIFFWSSSTPLICRSNFISLPTEKEKKNNGLRSQILWDYNYKATFAFVLGKINLFLAVNYMLEINIKLAAWNWLSLSAVREHCSESCVQVLLMLSDTWTELRTILMGFIISFFFRCGIARRVSTLSPPTLTISTTWSCGSTYPRTLQTGDNMVMLSFVHCHWLLSTEQFFFFLILKGTE